MHIPLGRPGARRSGPSQVPWPWLLALVVLLASGCTRIYYDTLEKFGFEKRDILVDRVEDARDAQEDAREQFQSALEQFQALIGREDSDLQRQYEALKDAYEDSEATAKRVRDRIAAVEDVSEALFEEWEEELQLYSSAELRQDSTRKLRETRSSYERLIQVMHQAAARMDPVLAVLRDQVLYLKHNLNARAIDRLQGELRAVEADVDRLMREMAEAIQEADAFIRRMRQL